MEFLVVADKFKGCLDSVEVADTIASALRAAAPDFVVHSVVASDGGDGLLDALEATDAGWKSMASQTQDAAGRPHTSRFLMSADGKSAVVEMAQTAGLAGLPESLRNPLRTSTFGTGEQILQAIEAGAKTIYIGLGGSATTDGGIGLASALGYQFLDDTGQSLSPVGESLGRLESIALDQVDPRIGDIQFVALNDVTNPLYGPQGAAFVYGPQKGASPEDVQRLDEGLRRLADCVRVTLPGNDPHQPGAGAAGGLGFGLASFLNAKFQPGAPFLLCRAGVLKRLAKQPVDWLITGEGCIDQQSLQGKWIHHVLQLSRRFEIPVAAFCGQCRLNPQQRQDSGLTAIVELHDPNIGSIEQSLLAARNRLTEKVHRWAQSLPPSRD